MHINAGDTAWMLTSTALVMFMMPGLAFRLPEVSATVVRLLTPGQVLALASAMPSRCALLVLLGAGAGLRQGEAFGLELDRIDARAGIITVDQQVVVVERRPVLARTSPEPWVPRVPLRL
jgi:integrase